MKNFCHTLSASLLVAALAAPELAAQNFLQPGAFVGAGGGWIGVLAPNGANATPYPLQNGISTVLWDPSEPDSFVVARGSTGATTGSMSRVTFVGPGQTLETPIAPTGSFAQPVALCWDQTGNEVVFVTSFHRVHRVDVHTGAVTNVTTGTQPWGNTTRAVALDPSNGDVYVGCSNGELYRLGSGGGNPQLVMSGLGSATELLIDAGGGRHNLFFVSTDRMARVDLDSFAAPEWIFGSFGTPSNAGTIRSASFDQNGDIALFESYEVLRVPNVAQIPPGGIAPTLVGSHTYPSTSGYNRHGTVVGSTTRPFRMIAEAVPPLGAYLAVENVPADAAFGFTFFSAATLLPRDSGPFFGLMPDGLTLLVLGLPATPGSLFSYTGNAPQPVAVPPLGMAVFVGQTWDFVSVAFDGNGTLAGRSNVVRVTWN